MKLNFKAQGDHLPNKNPVIQYLQKHAADIAIATVLTAVIIGITLLSLDASGANRIPSNTVFANPYYPETTFWRFVMVVAAGLAGFGIGWFFSDAGKEVRFIVVLIALGLWAFAVFFDNGPIGWGLASFAAVGAFLVTLGYWTAKAVKAFAAPITTMGSAKWATEETLHAEDVIGDDGFRLGHFFINGLMKPIRYIRDRHLLTVAPKITTMPGYTWLAKVYELPSANGIDGGTISKLDVRKDSELIAHYDRGWDIHPRGSENKQAVAKIQELFDGPKQSLEITRGDVNQGGWIDGNVKSMTGYSFRAHVTALPSDRGMDGGKIDKLHLRRDGYPAAFYDGKWGLTPETAEDQKALEKIQSVIGGPKREFQPIAPKSPDKNHGHDR